MTKVSALATNYEVVIQGLWGPVSGTSAATPVWAALVAELNQRQAEASMPPLGFMNPWLYQLPKVGYDPVEGSNAGSSWFCKEGFTAGSGYDAVTGLGTPDHAFLIENLPHHSKHHVVIQ